MTVRRVHWLRARAQANRWAEEQNLTSHEMGWTTRFFLFKADQWRHYRDYATREGQAGAMAYAEQEIFMWTSMARQAEDAFAYSNSGYVRLL